MVKESCEYIKEHNTNLAFQHIFDYVDKYEMELVKRSNLKRNNNGSTFQDIFDCVDTYESNLIKRLNLKHKYGWDI